LGDSPAGKLGDGPDERHDPARAALDAKIQSFAEQHGISYAEAAAQITE